MSLAHMRFGENPDPATPAEKVSVCGGVGLGCGDGISSFKIRELLCRLVRMIFSDLTLEGIVGICLKMFGKVPGDSFNRYRCNKNTISQ